MTLGMTKHHPVRFSFGLISLFLLMSATMLPPFHIATAICLLQVKGKWLLDLPD